VRTSLRIQGARSTPGAKMILLSLAGTGGARLAVLKYSEHRPCSPRPRGTTTRALGRARLPALPALRRLQEEPPHGPAVTQYEQ
jgi:hypothetical protein